MAGISNPKHAGTTIYTFLSCVAVGYLRPSSVELLKPVRCSRSPLSSYTEISPGAERYIIGNNHLHTWNSGLYDSLREWGIYYLLL